MLHTTVAFSLALQLTKIIQRIMTIHMFPPVNKQAFADCQFSCRPKRWARDAVLLYVATWKTTLNNGRYIRMYCYHASGAFDRVCAERLPNKIASLGPHRDFFWVMKNWLRDCQVFTILAMQWSVLSILSNMIHQSNVFVSFLLNTFVRNASLVFEFAMLLHTSLCSWLKYFWSLQSWHA